MKRDRFREGLLCEGEGEEVLAWKAGAQRVCVSMSHDFGHCSLVQTLTVSHSMWCHYMCCLYLSPGWVRGPRRLLHLMPTPERLLG